MIAAYESGDPYSDWARKAGYMPAGGDKYSHPLIRAVFKRASLGILYGMGAKTLSEYVGISELAAPRIAALASRNLPTVLALERSGTRRRYCARRTELLGSANLKVSAQCPLRHAGQLSDAKRRR